MLNICVTMSRISLLLICQFALNFRIEFANNLPFDDSSLLFISCRCKHGEDVFFNDILYPQF